MSKKLAWKPEAIAEWKRDIIQAEKELKTAKTPRQIENIKNDIERLRGYVKFLENGPSISEVK
jgi:hypothetical protein